MNNNNVFACIVRCVWLFPILYSYRLGVGMSGASRAQALDGFIANAPQDAQELIRSFVFCESDYCFRPRECCCFDCRMYATYVPEECRTYFTSTTPRSAGWPWIYTNDYFSCCRHDRTRSISPYFHNRRSRSSSPSSHNHRSHSPSSRNRRSRSASPVVSPKSPVLSSESPVYSPKSPVVSPKSKQI